MSMRMDMGCRLKHMIDCKLVGLPTLLATQNPRSRQKRKQGKRVFTGFSHSYVQYASHYAMTDAFKQVDAVCFPIYTMGVDFNIIPSRHDQALEPNMLQYVLKRVNAKLHDENLARYIICIPYIIIFPFLVGTLIHHSFFAVQISSLESPARLSAQCSALLKTHSSSFLSSDKLLFARQNLKSSHFAPHSLACP